RSVLAEQLSMEEQDIDLKSDLQGLGMDSLAILELVMALEMEFDIDIADEEMNALHKVEDIAALVYQKI
ncbi:MAG: phosphopantetheine-binding protein, partial [Clostridiales bacterium]